MTNKTKRLRDKFSVDNSAVLQINAKEIRLKPVNAGYYSDMESKITKHLSADYFESDNYFCGRLREDTDIITQGTSKEDLIEMLLDAYNIMHNTTLSTKNTIVHLHENKDLHKAFD